MRIEDQWLSYADEILHDNKIIDKDGKFHKAYKGYISSYGAAIVQSGLIAASIFFERTDSNAEADTSLVVKSVVDLLKKEEKLPEITESLAKYASNIRNNQMASLLRDVDKAIATFKLVLRQYSAIDEAHSRAQANNRNTPVVSLRMHDAPVLSSKNLGWAYFREYYRNVIYTSNPNPECNLSKHFRDANETLFAAKDFDFSVNRQIINTIVGKKSPCKFNLKTTYPGLLIGSGLAHGTGQEGDLKIGFIFDYTTGLPYIPGSSVKGVIRSAFPENETDLNRIKYICEKLGLDPKINGQQIVNLKQFLFENKLPDGRPVTNVFCDALIIAVDNGNSQSKTFKILGDDFVTPHLDISKNPIPIQFLKVLPEVKFCFSFKISDKITDVKFSNESLSKELIIKLFKSILKDVGVGAKTNVGYGALVE